MNMNIHNVIAVSQKIPAKKEYEGRTGLPSECYYTSDLLIFSKDRDGNIQELDITLYSNDDDGDQVVVNGLLSMV